jgi:hypothetical protein
MTLKPASLLLSHLLMEIWGFGRSTGSDWSASTRDFLGFVCLAALRFELRPGAY